jgi:mannan endo-1,4-beta-mannosidase
MTGGKKLVTMSENDTIPQVSNLQNEMAGWLYFCPWYGWWLTGEQNNPVEWLIEMYKSEYCITLDELPDLKSYPVSGFITPLPPPPSPTSSTPNEPEILYGDLNGDKKINAGDYTLLRRYILGNIKEFSVPLRAADLNLDGKVNAGDYTILRRYILGSILKLPFTEK